MGVTEFLFLGLFFGLPALGGAWLAKGRARNPLVWGVVSGLFPFVLLVLWYQKPDCEVPGHFRKCAACGAVYPWKQDACRYCGTPKN